jgi:VanZ family protein
MLQIMRTWLKGKMLLIAVAITLILVILSLIKIPAHNFGVTHQDKWQHCFAYFVLSISWLIVFYKKKKKLVVVVCCILLGVIIEILQNTLTSYRTGDYHDVIANSLGVLLGLFVVNKIGTKIEVKK